jgi:hypothetical protein
VKSLQTGTNAIEHPDLRRYYEHVRRVVSGPIWRWSRFVSIWKLHTGALDHLIPTQELRYPDALELDPAASSPEAGTAPRAGHELKESGARFRASERGLTHAPELVLSVSADDWFTVEYERAGRLVARQSIEPLVPRLRPHRVHRLRVPQEASRQGYDAVRVVPAAPTSDWRAWHFAPAADGATATRLVQAAEAFFAVPAVSTEPALPDAGEVEPDDDDAPEGGSEATATGTQREASPTPR